MTEQESISKENEFYSEQYLEKFFNMAISSIGEQSSPLNSEVENTNVKDIMEKNHYLCKECKTLHLLNIIYEEKKANEKIEIEEKIIIECNKKGKINLDKFLEDISNLENLDNYKLCQTHKENEIIGFCQKCKKNLCLECKEENDCTKEGKHSFKDFKKKNEEISKKEEIILEILREEYYYIKKTKNGSFMNSQKSNGTTISFESHLDLLPLCQFIKALKNSKEKIPSYIHYQNIINIYNYLYSKLKIKYHCFNNNKANIRLFGEIFIQNNRNLCYVKINNELKRIENCEFYELKKSYTETDLNIILIKKDEIIDMSYMFNDCEELESISDDSKWNTSNVINMSYMFCNCKSLSCLPKFMYDCDTSKVKDMSNMFDGCEKINRINDISDWNTSKVESMCKMFYGCASLENLENILTWNTKNVTDMSYMFYNCSKLKSIDTEKKNKNKVKWNTEKVENMSYMFYGCENLEQLPDSIASWDISKVVYIQYMFYNCKNLTKLPDISKWNTQKVVYMNDLFGNCSSLENLPDIKKWNLESLIDIDFFIDGCTSLKAFPDLSNWANIQFKEGELLKNCFSKKNIS